MALRPPRLARPAALWLLVLLVCAMLLAFQLWRGAAWDSRITALLPATTDDGLLDAFAARQEHLGSDYFVLLVSGERAGAALATLEQHLYEQELIHPNELTAHSLLTPLQRHTGHLLADARRQQSPQQWVELALGALFAPGRGTQLRQDPFALQADWLRQINPLPLDWQDGYPMLQAEGQHWLVFNARLQHSAYDLPSQRQLLAAINQMAHQQPQLTLLRAGLVFHAAHAAQQAQREISLLGGGSLLLICLLLWTVFRHPLTLVSLLLPVACGVLFALPLTWLLFDTLNLLTLAFGISLIGIGIDYALHVQCYRLAHGDQQLQCLWPALRLGLFSSLLAYLAQLFTPLPGLQQMACFLMLGLIGAWLSARLWLPHWPQARQPGSQRALMRVADWRLPARWQAPLTGLVVLALPLLLLSAELRPDNDLRQLNPSPPALIQEQQQVMGWLQQVSGQRFVLLSAGQAQALLQRLEQLDALLGQLQADGELSAYDHLARRVPSLRRQQADHALLKARYATAVPDLLQRAGLPAELGTDIQQALGQSTPLLPQDWLATVAGQADQSLWWRTDKRLHAAILLGDLSPAGQARLLSHLQADEIYHDRVTHLGNTLGTLRDSVSHWLLVACLCLLPLLLWRYRRQAWRALLPPFGAVILALALLGWLGQGITLFHLLGLLLVLGIGLDSGIFNAEHGQQTASWLAITLSCASSLIAFGLLSLSSTPALHQLGLTCLIGLASVWGLTLLSRPSVTTKET